MTLPEVVGITGLPCSGKSFAAELLASGRVDGMAWEVLKADNIGHEILSRPEILERLAGYFGPEAVRADDPAGTRKAIAARVFTDESALVWLENLVHPLVAAEVDRVVGDTRGRAPVIVEAALLFAAGMERRCDRVLVIEAPFPVRLRRAAERGWSREELERRQERQIPLFEAAWSGPERDKLVRIDNDGDAAALTLALRQAVAAR